MKLYRSKDSKQTLQLLLLLQKKNRPGKGFWNGIDNGEEADEVVPDKYSDIEWGAHCSTKLPHKCITITKRKKNRGSLDCC